MVQLRADLVQLDAQLMYEASWRPIESAKYVQVKI